MGGTVVKIAFIPSQDVEDFSDRIQRIFFLGTPHQGADYAAILNSIRPYPGSCLPENTSTI